MSDTAVVFLGVMAVALVAMAAAQLVAAITMMRAAQRITASVEELKGELRPLVEKANRIADDARQVAAIAAAQAERLDALVLLTSQRVSETVGLLQKAVIEPVRQGAAILAAVRAGLAALRGPHPRAAGSKEDEDPLFVG